MSKGERTSNFQLKSELARAAALLEAGRYEEAVPLLREIAPRLRTSDGCRMLIVALERLGREEEAQEATLAAARDRPGDHELGLRAALLLYERNDWEGAAALFARLSPHAREEPEILARYAHALFMLGRRADALGASRAAFGRKGRGVPALVHGLVCLDCGDLGAAQESLERAAQSIEGSARAQADGLLGLVLFWRGETRRALEIWKRLDASGSLESEISPFLALAAATHGEEQLARLALARLPDAKDPFALLATARVELTLGRSEQALAALEQIADPPELLAPLATAARGRALRMLGRADDALELLEPLAGALGGPVGAMVHVDLGRLRSDAGEHEGAAEHFRRALELDPGSEEAARGLALARERTAWREVLAADAEGRVAAARAEAEQMRRAFADKERELEMLRTRLAQTEKAAAKAREEAERAREQAERDRREALRKELETRETEATERAEETLREAFGEALERCPPPLLEAIRVAEITYQKALYTELHPAAVAVLFSGALERGLYLLVVRPFDQWLTGETRQALLKASTRELRPGHVEYFDRFVEAFDPSRRARAPSLGEVARALSRRHEPHLAVFNAFLSASFNLDDGWLDAIASFVERMKEQLRDPVAHGRALELPQQDLADFRRALLLDLWGRGRGALPALVAARR
ncbi:MAG: hypothetical protein ACOX6T_11030 [Myxococcales bacterium]